MKKTLMLFLLALLGLTGAVFAANEITASASINVAKSNLRVNRESGGRQITMTGDALYHNVQVCGATYEAITIPSDIGTAGYSWWQNHGTNTVYIGSSTSNRLMTLMVGEVAMFRLGTNKWTIATAAGNCAVEYLIIEE